ncbi:MAG: mechanosensitive ion channel family protein [bacterium]|nr:mechanosensitive ion channel family protein [bacterium]
MKRFGDAREFKGGLGSAVSGKLEVREAMRTLRGRICGPITIFASAVLFVCACGWSWAVPQAAGEPVVTNVESISATTNVLDRLLDDFSTRAETVGSRYWWGRAKFLGVYVWQIVWSVVIIFVTIVIAQVGGYLLQTRLGLALARANVPHADRVVSSTLQPLQGLIYVVGLMLVGSIMAVGRGRAWVVVDKAGKVLLALMIIWLVDRIVDVLANVWVTKARTTTSKVDEQLIVLGRRTVKIVALVLTVIVLLDTLEVDVTALITGLGIGGLAVALALQDTLANFFSSIYLMIDRPFKVGDRITIDNIDGYVEEVGFRTTRIRTLMKTQVTVPNKTLANACVDNITRMHKRRVTQTIGVTYETTAEKMEEVLEALRKVLREDPEVDQEFIVVRFYDFGESSLNINVVYFTTMADYQEYLAVRERINLKFMRVLAELGVGIAFPTRTVYFEGEVARRMAREGKERGGNNGAGDGT